MPRLGGPGASRADSFLRLFTVGASGVIVVVHELVQGAALVVQERVLYLINQTPGEKLRHGVALRASVTLVKSCELLSQLDYFTLVLWIPVNS